MGGDRAIFVASANRGKLHELHALFAAGGLRLELYPEYASPQEGERSYTDNAALKAHALRDTLVAAGESQAVLADDSGLEVLALQRRPGVVTADYGGAATGWSARRALLLAEVAATGSLDRRARFVCAMHYIDPDGREFATLATVEGEIAAHESGELGFSFDPIFLYPPAGKTFAQLTDAEKNMVSHRAIAARAMLAAIEAAAVRLPGMPDGLRGTAAGERECEQGSGRSSAW